MKGFFKLIGILLVYGYRNVAFAQRSSYGEFCNKTIRCASQSWLTCQDELCDCAKPDEMIFDDGRGQCVSRAGERCKFNSDDSSEDAWYERTRCVENAKCNYEGTCVCELGYFENDSGTCSATKQYKDTCLLDKECDMSEKFLLCIDGRCQCNSTTSIFVEEGFMRNEYGDWIEGTRCVGLIGSDCLNDLCTEFATCDHNLKCVCNEAQGYTETSFKTCGRGFGFQCETEACSEQFNCLEGKCECKLSPYQIYDEETHLCRSLVGSKCSMKEFPCVLNAVCNSSSSSQCECKTGFVENNKGECDLAYGSPCEYGYQKCDTVASLYCKNKICTCRSDLEIYDAELRKCTKPLGSRCDDVIGSFCSANSECTKSHPELSGRCQCKQSHSLRLVDNINSCVPIDYEGQL